MHNSWTCTQEFYSPILTFEPPHDKTNKMAWAPSEDSDQPGHPPSLIRVFAVRRKKAWVLRYALSAYQRLWSDWADAKADLSLCWAHISFCWFCHEAAHFFLWIWEWFHSRVGPPSTVRSESLVRAPVWPHPFVEIWSWKNFYDHSHPSADSRRAVVSYWRKNGH